MHCREEAYAPEPVFDGQVHTLHRVRLRRIEHEIAMKSLWKSTYSDRYRRFIARYAGDQNGAPNAMLVEFLYPPVGQSNGIFTRDFNTEPGELRVNRSAFLPAQAFEKRMGEKVNMCVADGDVAPGRLHFIRNYRLSRPQRGW